METGKSALVSDVSRYRWHAGAMIIGSARSGRPPPWSRTRSRRRAASATTCASAAFTVSFFEVVRSARFAAASCRSSRSINVFMIPPTYIQYPRIIYPERRGAQLNTAQATAGLAMLAMPIINSITSITYNISGNGKSSCCVVALPPNWRFDRDATKRGGKTLVS